MSHDELFNSINNKDFYYKMMIALRRISLYIYMMMMVVDHDGMSGSRNN